MSAIDCVDHVHVATFCNIASVYWPIAEQKQSHITDLEQDKDKLVNKKNIIIGGGSGEHPALVLDIDYILWYTLRWDSQDVYKVPFPENGVSFESWDFVTRKNLYDSMIKGYMSDDTFEENVIYATAHLVLSELPLEECVSNPVILKYVLEVHEKKGHDHNYLSNFSGILNAQKYGRIIKNGELQWGYSLRDYYIDLAKGTIHE